MQHWWLSEAILALVCWWGSSRLVAMRTSAGYLVAVTLALLGLAALIGAAKFGLQWQARLDALDYYASRAFGIAGLYLLAMGLLDWTGWLRLHKGLWLAHLADAAIVFGLALWLAQLDNFQWVIALGANLLCLAAAVFLWRHGRASHAQWLGFAAVLFLVNALLVRGGPQPLLGMPVRMDLFHLLLAVWAYCITQVMRYPAQEPA